MADSQPRASHYPALDGLRGLSVLLVLFGHTFGQGFRVNGAGYGVQIFFVLSGLLITGILLECREQMVRGATAGHMLRTFYIRRALRIFPAYYLTLFVCVAFNMEYFRGVLPWHLFYGSNFLMWKINGWIGGGSHLWSLAVEEQFYLVWPVIILFVPKPALRWVCLAALAIGFTSICITAQPGQQFFSMLPTNSAIFLGMGATIAVLGRDSTTAKTALLVPAALGVGVLVSAVASLPVPYGGLPTSFIMALHCFMLSALYGWILIKCVEPSLISSAFSPAWLRYVGKISYGLYLYHFPLVIAAQTWWPERHSMQAIFVLGASFPLAAISSRWFEMPIRALGRRIPYISPISARLSSAIPQPVP